MDAIVLYGIGAALFAASDVIAGAIAGSKSRPLATVAFAAAWPLAFPLGLICSAILVTRLRQQATPTNAGGEAE